MSVQVKINTASKTVETFVIKQTPNATALIIERPEGATNIELLEQASGFAPQAIQTKHVGNDLVIFVDERADTSSMPDLIIKDYYLGENALPVVGMAEDGKLYSFIAENGRTESEIHNLAHMASATEVLGGEGYVPNMADAIHNHSLASGTFGWIFAGGAALLGATAIASSAHSSSGEGEHSVQNNNVVANEKTVDLSTEATNLTYKITTSDLLSKNISKLIVKLPNSNTQTYKVDLGGNNTDNDQSENLEDNNNQWVKQSNMQNNAGTTYDVYHYSTQAGTSYEVLIEHNNHIQVI